MHSTLSERLRLFFPVQRFGTLSVSFETVFGALVAGANGLLRRGVHRFSLRVRSICHSRCIRRNSAICRC